MNSLRVDEVVIPAECTVVGLFGDPEDAWEALAALEAAGFTRDAIRMQTHDHPQPEPCTRPATLTLSTTRDNQDAAEAALKQHGALEVAFEPARAA